MASKSSSRSAGNEPGDNADATDAIRDSAQKIWLAGLGAFERARTEGPRMFESLVEQGRNMGARAVGMADDALKNMREANYSGSRWDKLEQAFEERLSRSLSRLGVLTTREVEDLSRQVRELNETVQNLMGSAATRAMGAAPGSRGKRTARKSSRAASRTKSRAGARTRKSKASRAKRA